MTKSNIEIIQNFDGYYEIRRPYPYSGGYQYYGKGQNYWWSSLEYRHHSTKFWTLRGAKKMYQRLTHSDVVVYP